LGREKVKVQGLSTGETSWTGECVLLDSKEATKPEGIIPGGGAGDIKKRRLKRPSKSETRLGRAEKKLLAMSWRKKKPSCQLA